MNFDKEQNYTVFVCTKSKCNGEYKTHIVYGHILNYFEFLLNSNSIAFDFSGEKISTFENNIYSWDYNAIVIIIYKRTKNDYISIGFEGTLHWKYAVPDYCNDNKIRFSVYGCNRIF